MLYFHNSNESILGMIMSKNLSLTGLVLLCLAFNAVASLPQKVADVDIVPLGLACKEKVSSPSTTDSELLSILRFTYYVNEKQAVRVVSMLNSIPNIQKTDCKEVDITYNNLHSK